MNWKEIIAIAVSLALTVALWAVFDTPDIPLSCADGWTSSSIGEQGACSHHGGVTGGGNSTPWYLYTLSVVVGLVALIAMAKVFGLFQATEEIGPFSDPTCKAILSAIAGHHRIEFAYLKKGHTAPERRIITPMELKMLAPGALRSRCVLGYCHTSNDSRTFTLGRMSDVVVHEA